MMAPGSRRPGRGKGARGEVVVKRVTKDEATKFFKNFAKVNAQAMFNEVDEDGNGSIAYDEWIEFWRNVMGTGTYETEDVMEELESMMEGGAWVDWNDGRTT